ncbi:glycoside hydrolase family 16 protein [Ideonella sp.]|uniref:glycoside hydrolase family 16 protein n=1 Tax=Ideonella sp. TaxID=1929293 RepID=UPI0035AE8B1D
MKPRHAAALLGLALYSLGLIGAVLLSAGNAGAAEPQRFFDDFGYASTEQLAKEGGWTLRDGPGHPGVEGAQWRADAIGLAPDEALPGNQLLRLNARTDGTGAGTVQAQLCHARKYLAGTYAARVRFADEPVSGADGDPVIQTFYAVSPLRFDYDPQFSEMDWEYLANGGWGSDKTRLYGITWQTVRLDPWQAFNQPHEEFGPLGGRWHTLVMQVLPPPIGVTRWFVDGRQITEHSGRNHPVVPMAISFNLWFSSGGLLPPSAAPRVYRQDVDWVFHARNEVLSPADVDTAVAAWRQAGVARRDTVPPAEPALASPCNF